MKNTVKIAVIAALLSGFIFSCGSMGVEAAPAVSAGQGTGIASSGTGSPAASKDKAGEKKETEKKDAEKEPLLSLDGSALKDADFTVKSVKLGDSFGQAEKGWGKAETISHSNTMDIYGWEGIEARGYISLLQDYSHRKDLPSDFDLPGKGITEISVAGEKYMTPRDIHVGSSRENVLRRYGRPFQVFWDGENKEFFLVYTMGKKELSFTLEKDRVSRISMKVLGNKEKQPPKSYEDVKGKSFLPERDFRIAGCELGKQFTAHNFEEWEKKMANPREEIWYYSGYAVRLTAKSRLISALFLTDTRMVTPRGIALGDDVSTVDLVYGKPHRIEMDVSGSEPKTSYIYFSKGKSHVLIINFVKNKVEGFVSAVNPNR